jgi:hypothetical protein
MEVKICPKCDEHNDITARFCKRCDQEMRYVVITKLPSDEPQKKNSNSVDAITEKQTVIEETLFPKFVSRFLLGFFGWFLCISLFLGGVLVIMESMGPGGIILVLFTFVPTLATMLAIVIAFLIPIFRARRVPMRKNGMALGITTAYIINFVMNFILNMHSDPLWFVGSFLGWPFYMLWLDNLFGF